MTLNYENYYLKLAEDPTFWVVKNGIRRPLISMRQVYELGLRPLLIVSEVELLAIPTGPDSNPDRELPSIQELRDRFIGKTMWAIGSGPSIQYLTAKHFKAGPVVAINYAIQKVEPLKLRNEVYSLQKDKCFVEPKSATLLVHSWESKCCYRDYQPQYSFDADADFAMTWSLPSVVICLGLAVLWGCKEVKFLCCDSAVSEDCTALQANGEFRANPVSRQLILHKAMVEEWSKKTGMPFSYIIPEKEPEK